MCIVKHGGAPHEKAYHFVLDNRRVAQRLSGWLGEAEIVVALQVETKSVVFLRSDRSYQEWAFGLTFHHSRDGTEKIENLRVIVVDVWAQQLDAWRRKAKQDFMLSKAPKKYSA